MITAELWSLYETRNNLESCLPYILKLYIYIYNMQLAIDWLMVDMSVTIFKGIPRNISTNISLD